MFKLKTVIKYAGLCLFYYACAASAKTTINIDIGGHHHSSPPPPPPPPPKQVEVIVVEKEYDMFPAPISSHYFWKKFPNGEVPRRAVVGGHEGGMTLYICQAFYHGGVHPGKLVAGRCNITYGGVEIMRDNYRLLVGEGLDWRQPGRREVPRNAVPGGFENGAPLYICHAHYGFHGVHPGKVVAGNCNIGYGGQEIRIPDYEVLVSD
jgi:hypothetical protein